MAKLLRCVMLSSLLHAFSALASVEPARFDLTGPKIDIRVTRGDVSLPIASVPNLQPGDRIWLHPDLPPTQSVHYLLIAAFLRGTTNPPPDDWFIRIETWNKKVRAEGVTVIVPPEAQQALLFLAPETGGDFSTLRSAVRGRPGIFVRAAQDLNEAGFEQARIEKYLASMKLVPPSDTAALLDHSNLLARTLNLKPNQDCYKRPLDQQFDCLTQSGSQTLLDDGHANSIVTTLSSGSGSDFINAASTTGLAGGGTYSAYVGALVDLVRIMNNVHTAQYQYIPAIAFPENEALNLRLNTAPSFHNPKSVIVIGLPAIQASVLPPLRPADPGHVSCLLDPGMVLPIEGAPLVFSTVFAHDLVLHLDLHPKPGAPSTSINLPLAADAFQGGLTIAPTTSARHELALGDSPGFPANTKPELPHPPALPPPPSSPTAPAAPPVTGTVQGFWGFDRFTGPTLPLQQTPGAGWHILSASDASTNLIVGQPNHLQLTSSGTACVRTVSLEPGDARVSWKLGDLPPSQGSATGVVRPLDLTINLQHAAAPGSIHLAIQQFGQPEADQVGTKTFALPARIDALRFHAGDTFVTLAGESLDQVRSVLFRNLTFTSSFNSPEQNLSESLPPVPDPKSLTLKLASDAKPPTLKPNDKLAADIFLADGRILNASSFVLPPRPEISILSRRVASAAPSPIQLSSTDDLPLGAQLIFFVKSTAPFLRSEQVEVASLDQSLHTTLSVAAGTLILQDAHTILATFDALKTFGPSTFGAFHLRAIAADGTHGEWIPLVTIVRLPALTELRCPSNPTLPCLLSGSDLYLIDSISADSTFDSPTSIPEGFVENSLNIPHPSGSSFFLRLRDDTKTAQQVTLPILPESRRQTETPGSSKSGASPKASALPAQVSEVQALRDSRRSQRSVRSEYSQAAR